MCQSVFQLLAFKKKLKHFATLQLALSLPTLSANQSSTSHTQIEPTPPPSYNNQPHH